MEVFLLVVVVLIAVVIIGKLKGDPDIEKLDVAGLKREIWVTQNWINNYHSGGCPLKYQEKFQYKQSRLEQANERLNKLFSRQTTQNENAARAKPENVEQEISPELENSAEFKNALILDSIRQLTDLALSHGLIQSQDEAHKYWELFKKRIQDIHMKGESVTLDEIKSALVKELAPVFQCTSGFVKEGMSEELAMAQSIVNWYKTNNSLEQTLQPLSNNQFSDKEVNDLLSNAGRALDAGDYAKAVGQWGLAAAQGSAFAQYNLGLMYANGQGVLQNYKEAEKWWKLAAEHGHVGAQHNLGVMYNTGQGVSQDCKEGMRWYQLAAEQGYADAQYNLGVMYKSGQGVPQDSEEATKWFLLAAKQEHAVAQNNVGFMYLHGQGVSPDPKEAFKWYRQAAEQGHAPSQAMLGMLYQSGLGVAQDSKEAAKWWTLSAEQGFAEAQVFIAMLYQRDQGVPQDYVQSLMWLNIAATTNDIEKQKEIINMRDLVANKMTANQIAEAQELAKKRIAHNFKAS